MSAVVGTADEADTVTEPVAPARPARVGRGRPPFVASGRSPRASRLRRLWFLPAAVAAIGGAALIPSLGGDGVGPGEARLEVAGTATITEPDGAVRQVGDTSVVVGPGTTVEVTSGTTRFEMADDVRLEGVAGSAVGGRSGTTVTMGITPTLITGRLLAVAPVPLAIEIGGARTDLSPSDDDGPAAAHLAHLRGTSVSTYRGEVVVESAGRSAPVEPLRRREVAAPGELGRDGLPLRYRGVDPWDRRFLGDALAVDAQLDPLLTALPAELDARLLVPQELNRAVDGLPGPRDLTPLVDRLDSGGDALVLAAIATAAPGDVVDEWEAAAELRTAGARWGLVALDRGARPTMVVEAVRDALDSATVSVGGDPSASTSGADDSASVEPSPGTAGPAGGDIPAGTTPAGGGSPPNPSWPTAPSTGSPGTGSPGGSGGGGGTGSGGGSDPGGGTGGPGDGGIGGVVDGVGGTVGGVVDGVGGTVGGAVGGLGRTVEEAATGVGGLIGAVLRAPGGPGQDRPTPGA